VPRSDYEVIVVDDGSTDGTAEVALRILRDQASAHAERSVVKDREQMSPGVVGGTSGYAVLISPSQQGAGAARNVGARAASGDSILFLDADCTPERDWVEKMTQALQQQGVVGVSGVLKSRQRGLIPRFVQAEYDARYERILRQPSTDFVSSGTAGYDRRSFLDAGGFATEMGGAEDVDLSFRLSEAGHQLVLEPRAVVDHPHPVTLAAYTRRKFIYAFWRARVYERHPRKAVGDSRTPVSQKLQIGLVLLILVTLAMGLRWPVAWLLAAALAVGFLLTTSPFVIQTLRRDLPVGLIAPWVMLLSAATSAIGLMYGVLHRWLTARTSDPATD